MEQLIKSLPSVLRAAGDVDEVARTVAQAAWNHLAGEVLRQHTAVTDLQKQKLTVVVSDVIWQRQLESMSSQLIYRLNALLGKGTITFIEFRIDSEALAASYAKQEEPVPAEPQPLPVELVSAASSIQNPQLRRAFLGAASSSLRRKR
jgi:predicted nucleic acid-binding Zn ribbon protein